MGGEHHNCEVNPRPADPVFSLLWEMKRDFLDEVKLIHRRIDSHMENEEKGLRSIQSQLAELTTKHADIAHAFPHEDGKPAYIKHRIKHELDDQEDEDSRELKREGKKVVLSTVLNWIMGLLQLGFLAYLASRHLAGG